MNQHIKNHYSKLAKIYDELWFYSDEFVSNITSNIIQFLTLKDDDKLVDLGCGTGIYSKGILKQVKLNHDILCVDLTEEMFKRLKNYKGLFLLCEDAIKFSAKPYHYNKLFIKEMIHHIPDHDRSLLFTNLYKQIEHKGQLLIIMLPPTIDYPLFDKALRLHKKLHAHYQDVSADLEKSGFKVEVKFVEYPLSIQKDTYIKMVSNRYLSLLSYFDDQTLAEGVNEMVRKFSQEKVLNFIDRFAFIHACKC